MLDYDATEIYWLQDGTVAAELDARVDDGDDFSALDDLVQDEYGVRPVVGPGGELFEIVAVPDDVARASPAPGEWSIEIPVDGPCECQDCLWWENAPEDNNGPE